MGSVEMPMVIPTKIPRNPSPVCEVLKPWFVPKTSGKAPKNMYRIPKRMADKMQRFRH
jgi:hypothetical protein